MAKSKKSIKHETNKRTLENSRCTWLPIATVILFKQKLVTKKIYMLEIRIKPPWKMYRTRVCCYYIQKNHFVKYLGNNT